ncbi:hypothetical protein C7S16_5910 [Burkholderia thailandensis]|uniref:200 kDa antigen p200 n=1 Tax=Burkholderia thailandensis TaxID=57975 RepID=A0AAW9CQ22_BURTH|nr:hypothetical protein [Burkholderia thailandensis]MDW9251233.1 hypothetical protein [Burkholderia thailandensis]
MGCEDSAHGGLRNAVPGSRWEIGAQRYSQSPLRHISRASVSRRVFHCLLRV